MPQEVDRCRATAGWHALDPHPSRRAASVALLSARPGVIAFPETGHAAIQRAMEGAGKKYGVNTRVFVLRFSNSGADEEDQPVD